MPFGKFRKPAISRNNTKTKPLRVRSLERVSLSSPSLKASMTVEAAIVLPLFIFFMAEILYVFDMIRLQSRFLQALHETGTVMSEYAFYTEYALDDVASIADSATGTDSTSSALESLLGDASGLSGYGVSLVLSETYVQSSAEDYLGTEYLNNTCLDGGAASVSYLQSQIMVNNDIIDLVADYRVKPFLSIFGLDSFSMQSRYYGHAWTGYSIGSESSQTSTDDDNDGQIVYITPTGSVYHLSEDCTYLKPSTRTISASEVDSARSSDGSKYYPCEVCNPTKTGTLVITEDGNRYHSSASCSAIKRTVIEVLLSQVEDTMNCCSKCGG